MKTMNIPGFTADNRSTKCVDVIIVAGQSLCSRAPSSRRFQVRKLRFHPRELRE